MKLKNGVWKKINKDLYMIRVNNEIERIKENELIEKIRIKKFISEMINSNSC